MARNRTGEPLLLDRRQALALLGGTAFAGAVAPQVFAEQGPVFVSSVRLENGGCAIVTLGENGAVASTIPLPARGHDFATRQDGLTIAFARRPGTFAVAFNPRSAAPPKTFATPPDRHFNGHGAFSPDGRLLYASENDFSAGKGCIGIYHGATFERMGEMASGGVGPHEILILPNGLLAIANGGIATHPDFPRAKLNLATMRPNLTLLDPQTGTIVEREDLPATLHQLSIRHMVWAQASGDLWFGCQWQGQAGAPTPLVGRYRPGGQIRFLPTPQGGWQAMRGYIGSVAADEKGQTIAVTSPRGGRVLLFDASGQLAASHAIEDVCGAGFSGPVPTFSDGSGHIHRGPRKPAAADRVRAFDNHLRRLSI